MADGITARPRLRVTQRRRVGEESVDAHRGQGERNRGKCRKPEETGRINPACR
jgi:hypothetical protein